MRFPVLGDSLPKRGNGFSTWLGQAFLNAVGWRIEGNFPDVPKLVVILAPHTSGWDFFIGVAAKFALRIRVTFLGKDTLFRWPTNRLMRWLGGIPVDRSTPHGVVRQMVDDFARRGQLALALAPQGTRRKGTPWHEGFYHIALGAGVPIVPVTLDYARRVLAIGLPLRPTGDRGNEIARLKKFCSGTYPAQILPPVSEPPR
jgi:1-acyl-sn-glycerol-3-phosphate acyltransferase